MGSNRETPSSVPFSLLSITTSIETSGKTAYVPAQDLGYYLWQDADDDEWHLRWSGDSVTTYRFNGTTVVSSEITSLNQYSFEGNDEISSTNNVVSFSAFAGAGEDGLDFTTEPGSQLNLDLSIDDLPLIELIYIGGNASIPASIPFSLYSP